MATLEEIQSASDAVLANLRERKAYTSEIAAKANAIDAASPTAKEDLAAIKAEYDSATEKYRSKQKQLNDTFIRLAGEGAGFFNKSQGQAIVDRTEAEMNSIISGGNPALTALDAKDKEITQTAAVRKESAASNTAESAIPDAEKNTTPLNNTISETPNAAVTEKTAKPKPLTKKEPNTAKKVEKQKQQEKSTARPNPLFKYANYTYGLSLHVLPPDDYNSLIKSSGSYTPNGTVLIASGGRRNDSNFKRHPDFNEDFYFKDFKFTTVVGMNARTKNTNAITLNFTIIEPYGMTLVNRLLSMCKKINAKSWMQIPFMIQIDFFGNTDEGEVENKIPGQTKYIPIKILGLDIKITKDGGEYQIQAVPFTHQAYIDSNVRTPAAFEVVAKTIKDFFGDDKTSYTTAINAFQKKLVKDKLQKHPEIYEFKIDPEIEKSALVFPKRTANNKIPVPDLRSEKGKAQIRSNAGIKTNTFDKTKESFVVNAGTSIVDVINQVMRNSEYIRNQITDPTIDPQKASDGDIQGYAKKSGKAIDWYKIVPVIEIKDFDEQRDTYSKKITYHIKKYKFYNTKYPNVPLSLPEKALKEYNYIFTGKNDSILDFELNFDTMFYTVITADKFKFETNTPSTMPEETPAGKAPSQKQEATVTDSLRKNMSDQKDLSASQGGSPDAKGQAVNDLYNASLSNSRGDMISLNLKIIGDPEFIKQDDVFFNPENGASDSPGSVDSNGSLAFDVEEIHALINFRTPSDFDQSTGLMKFDGPSSTSVFSGLYRVLTVDNEFRSGQFLQTLELVRLFGQEKFDDPSGENKTDDQNRIEPPKTIAESKSPSENTGKNPRPIPSRTPANEETAIKNPARIPSRSKLGDGEETLTKFPSRSNMNEVKKLMDLKTNLKNSIPIDINKLKNQ